MAIDKGQQFSYSDIENAHPNMVDEGLEDAVRALANGKEGNSFGEHSDPPENYELRNVPISKISQYIKYDDSDPRMRRAAMGYKNEDQVPPTVLVNQAGMHEIADGHHRIAAATHVGLTHVPAYVADSFEERPHPGFE